MTTPKLKRKSKEILQFAKEVCKKMELMDSIMRPLVEGKPFPVQFKLDETVNFYKFRISSQENNGINGQIYFPKALNIEPEKLELVRGKSEEEGG